ncbi:MAG TPA: ATP-binding cassette domain-containing protein, partial [Pseudonocardiaceae bacterium]
MRDGRIEASGLTKVFGQVTAVRDVSFAVEPGSVTGVLGPNGAGKTTTLRMLLGLVRPTAGRATIGGAPVPELRSPGRVVGAVPETPGFHPARTGLAHLRACAAAIGVPRRRVPEVLELTGLAGAAERAARGYSPGVRQRLALATALLGDPPVLVLDEPASGLDPEGAAWLRGFLRAYAQAGRTVLLSGRLLADVEPAADRIVVLGRGECVHAGPLADLRARQRRRVLVTTPDVGARG